MKYEKRLLSAAVAAAFATGLGLHWAQAVAAELEVKEQLGEKIFFDKNLSLLRNQACATCHVPEAGWVGDDTKINEGGGVYEGSIPGEFGNRNPPSSAYATPSPVFWLNDEGLFEGGNFWDGRATGWELWDPSAEQARGPFLNPVEQALPDKACVVYRVCEGKYGALFDEVWGPGACAIDWPGNGVVNQQCVKSDGAVPLSDAARDKVDEAYDNIARSISAFEDSPASNAYSSKLDAVRAGLATFTEQEALGRVIFRGKGMCSACHVGSSAGNADPPLFTDFTFDNLGVPRNPQNPASIADPTWRDPGLGGFLATLPEYVETDYPADNLGKHKVPTLRNVGLGSCEAQALAGAPPKNCITKAYMHNGYFNSLWQVVHFYNTRDTKPVCEDIGIDNATVEVALANDCWPEPEVGDNVNSDELGNLGLTPEQEDALVAFMLTMSDGYLK
jgi:cytochrome c peroxidase